MKQLPFLTLMILLISSSCNTDKNPKYLNQRLPVEKRVDDLVSRMTLEEKVSQLVFEADAIDRLNIPEYNWWNECLHGVARSGKATVFPQAIGMAATWDREMMFEMADVTSTEARAKYNDFQAKGKRGIYQGLTFWSPNINIFRDPRWGRGMETYGEDPYLSGELGTQFIKGLQGDHPDYFKVIATSKHYAVHSGPEPIRHSFDAVISERDFRDTYFPAFKKTVEDGKVYSVMCAYNRYQNTPCCGSDPLLEQILRKELGFQGYVVSDCWAIKDFYDGHNVVNNATDAAAVALMSGTDLNCGVSFNKLVPAFEQGLVSEAHIDVAVKRLMTARMKLGMFDPEENNPWIDLDPQIVACSKHNRVALEMARKSIVLLKNENNALPLSEDIEKIAVLGPNAADVEVLCGNYNGTPFDPVTPLQGIVNKIGDDGLVRYSLGCPHAEGLPQFEIIPERALYTDSEKSEQGLIVEYYDKLEAVGSPLLSGKDKNIDINWWDMAPREELVDDSFSVKWKGFFVPEKTGTYAIGCEAKYFNLKVDGKQLVRNSNEHHPNKVSANIDLKAGQAYELEVTCWDGHGDAMCHLIWAPPAVDYQKDAMKLVSWADHVIMFMGLSPRLEGEEMRIKIEGFAGGDRQQLGLPQIQLDLIKKVVASGKPVTLVLLNGSALALNWENENIPAIVEAWYPGETAGTAIADVLFGKYNPAGRLPVTFYKSVDDLPPFENYDMVNRTYRYFEGEVLYPFGYGLSYSTFKYSNLILDQEEISADGTVTVSVDVTNESDIRGEEVVQLYIHDVEASDARPNMDLRGFERVKFKAGETKTISFTLGADELAYYNIEAASYLVEPGNIEIFVGPSSDRSQLMMTNLVVK